MGGGLLIAKWVQSSGACRAVEVVGGAFGSGGNVGIGCRLVQCR